MIFLSIKSAFPIFTELNQLLWFQNWWVNTKKKKIHEKFAQCTMVTITHGLSTTIDSNRKMVRPSPVEFQLFPLNVQFFNSSFHIKFYQKAKVLVAQSYLTLCNPMECSPPGSSVHRISQARILEWVVISFSRGSSWLRDWTWVSCIAGRFFTSEPPGKHHCL